MKKVIVLLGIILLGYAFKEFSPFEKKLIANFTAQIRELQQEKVYLHTDKSVYTVGDKLWFRAYQVHAAAMFPMVFSHYIYVDLIDRRDSVIQRVKVVGRDSCFFGRSGMAYRTCRRSIPRRTGCHFSDRTYRVPPAQKRHHSRS